MVWEVDGGWVDGGDGYGVGIGVRCGMAVGEG